MLHIFLLRHGETSWNADGNRYCGRTDLPLTDKGIAQAKSIRKKLKTVSFDSIYASPLQRAFRTAQIASGTVNVVTDERLVEVDFGEWEGKSKETFIQENKKRWEDWMADPTAVQAGGTGETAGEVAKRVDDFYQSLNNNDDEKNILVVGHNGINRIYLTYKLGMPLRNYRKFFLDNAAVTEFELDSEGELTLYRLNAT